MLIDRACDFPPLRMFGVRFTATMRDGRTGPREARALGLDAADAVVSLAAHLGTTVGALHVMAVRSLDDADHGPLNGQGVARMSRP